MGLPRPTRPGLPGTDGPGVRARGRPGAARGGGARRRAGGPCPRARAGRPRPLRRERGSRREVHGRRRPRRTRTAGPPWPPAPDGIGGAPAGGGGELDGVPAARPTVGVVVGGAGASTAVAAGSAVAVPGDAAGPVEKPEPFALP
ncbi:hypothetical protein D7V97_09860 [Corallococcus sp. CA053C]|nr:hypothetical protein D7V97_09860 [Corallococcus sp. CA053C]